MPKPNLRCHRTASKFAAERDEFAELGLHVEGLGRFSRRARSPRSTMGVICSRAGVSTVSARRERPPRSRGCTSSRGTEPRGSRSFGGRKWNTCRGSAYSAATLCGSTSSKLPCQRCGRRRRCHLRTDSRGGERRIQRCSISGPSARDAWSPTPHRDLRGDGRADILPHE
jgi:hypothetical protein